MELSLKLPIVVVDLPLELKLGLALPLYVRDKVALTTEERARVQAGIAAAAGL